MSKANSLPRDGFVRKLAEAKLKKEPLVQVQGFVGDSTVSGYFRLYADSTLNNYVDIPESDVVHFEKRPTDTSPLGGLIIWLSKDAVYAYGDETSKNRPQQKFLQGQIADRAITDLVGYTPISWVVTGCPIDSGWHTCKSHFYTDCRFDTYFGNCRTTGGNTIFQRTDILTKTSALDACPSALGCTRNRLTDRGGLFQQNITDRYRDAGFGQFRP